MNLGSSVRSLSFCLLLNTQMINTTARTKNVYKAMAVEKSMLIILCGEVNLYCLPFIGREVRLLHEKIVAYIAQGKQVHL